MLVDGPDIRVTAPVDPASRAAVSGLIHGPIRPGKRVRVPLDALTRMVRARGAALSPGAVGAHATGRRVAVRAAEHRTRLARENAIMAAFVTACDAEPRLTGTGTGSFADLRRAGWVARMHHQSDPEGFARAVVEVAGRVLGIPDGERFDRRLLVSGDPHALDDGRSLAGAVLALLSCRGAISSDSRTTARSAWGQVGVDCDNLSGGLTALGIWPTGWTVPLGVACTLPPRELTDAFWPPPPTRGRWVFVTENPSILAAAADMVTKEPVLAEQARLICTMGTPSDIEIASIARLAVAGWRVTVRADFDAAGIRHVTRLLEGIPEAVPWRMGRADFMASSPALSAADPSPATPWDPSLGTTMTETATVAFEEALLPILLADLRAGHP
jgi:uncharacterized protein (TIGR02679 family)